MTKNKLRWGWLGAVLLALGFVHWGAAQAATLTFTVTAPSAFLRAQPSFAAPRMYSVFAGQSYAVTGRNADATWVLLDFAGAAPGTSWIPASFGTVDGNLGQAPVTDAAPLPAPTQTGQTGNGNAAPPAGSGLPIYYTVTAKSLFARSGPSVSNGWLASLFEGQRYAANARSADGLWLRLALPGGGQGWVPAAFGTVSGSISLLPVAGANSPAPTGPAPTAEAAATAAPGLDATPPTVSQAARDLYQRGLSLGNRPTAFSKIGDCNSVGPFFLAPFDKGEYRLGPYAYLQDTITQFAGSFNRDGAAAMDGINVMSMLQPLWANPTLCQPGESPLACELRLHQPSIAIISLGTNGYWHSDQEYETYMRQIVDELIARGVVPIFSTKADNLEGGDRFNQIVRRLAGEYDMPLWDFAATAHSLPGGGLADAYHLTWGRPLYDTARQPYTGWQARNLTALQALDAVWRGVR